MYTNKKIFTLINTDLYDPRNTQTPPGASDGENLSSFLALYKLPDTFTSIENYNHVQNENSCKMPYQSGYGYRDPYTERRITYKALMNGYDSHPYPKLLHQLNTIDSRGSFRDSKINSLIATHQAFSTFEYNWQAHQEFQESSNYMPLIFESGSDFHDSAYHTFLKMGSNELAQIESCIPGYKIYPPDEVVFVFWKKTSNKYNLDPDDINSPELYSNIPSGLFYKLKSSVLNYNQQENVFVYKEFHDYLKPTNGLTRNRAFYNCRNSLLPILNKTFVPGPGWDIFFFKNTTYHDYFKEIISNFTSSRLDVLKIPGWKTKSSDKHIEITSYTRSQCLKRQISLIPYVVQRQVLNSNQTVTNVNYLTFVSCGDFSDLDTCSRALKRFNEVLSQLIWKDGIKLYDLTKVQEIYQAMYAGLNYYSDVCCSKLNEVQLNSLTELQIPPSVPLDNLRNNTLTASPRVDLALKTKYRKIDSLYKENLNHLGDSQLIQNTREIQRNVNNIKSIYSRIEDLQSQIQITISSLVNNIKNVYNSANFIAANKTIYNTIKTKYLDSYAQAFLSQDYLCDTFFENLSKDKISIIALSYKSYNYEKTLTWNTDSSEFARFVKEKHTFPEDFKIKQVEFIIDRTVNIQIDNKNKFIVGGPYKVRLDESNIDIALLYNYSLFGIEDSASSFCVHPHTSTYNTPHRLLTYTRGCLGEAASLIYSAFKKNDLKLIVLSAMTWVASANSTDAWGKKYSWFIDPCDLKESKDLESEIKESKTVTDEDVESFLTKSCEEESSPEDIIPIPVLPDLTDHEEEQLLQELYDNANEIEDTETPNVAEPSQNLIQDSWNPQEFAQPPQNYTPAFATANINS